jgi:hypothetical protein
VSPNRATAFRATTGALAAASRALRIELGFGVWTSAPAARAAPAPARCPADAKSAATRLPPGGYSVTIVSLQNKPAGVAYWHAAWIGRPFASAGARPIAYRSPKTGSQGLPEMAGRRDPLDPQRAAPQYARPLEKRSIQERVRSRPANCAAGSSRAGRPKMRLIGHLRNLLLPLLGLSATGACGTGRAQVKAQGDAAERRRCEASHRRRGFSRPGETDGRRPGAKRAFRPSRPTSCVMVPREGPLHTRIS